MSKKIGIICTICIFIGIIFYKMSFEPQIVTSVSTIDRVYITILVNPSEIINLEKLEEKIVEMCEKRFEERNYDIQVYPGKIALKNGCAILHIKKDAGE